EWYYKSLLGINASSPGFRTFEIKPQPAGDLTWAKGHYDAVVGRISSEWEIEGTSFNLKVSVPANTQARIYVPAISGKNVIENGQPANESPGLTFIGFNDGYAVFDAVSGEYLFNAHYF